MWLYDYKIKKKILLSNTPKLYLTQLGSVYSKENTLPSKDTYNLILEWFSSLKRDETNEDTVVLDLLRECIPSVIFKVLTYLLEVYVMSRNTDGLFHCTVVTGWTTGVRKNVKNSDIIKLPSLISCEKTGYQHRR